MAEEHTNPDATETPQPPAETRAPKQKPNAAAIVAIILLVIILFVIFSKRGKESPSQTTPPPSTEETPEAPASPPGAPETIIDTLADDLLSEELEASPEETDPALTGENNAAIDDLGGSLGETQF